MKIKRIRTKGVASLASVWLLLLTMTGALASAQEAENAPLSYRDPVTDIEVTRVTTDGTDGCVNYMGNLSGEAESWSPDSSRVAFAKACDNDSTTTGVHVLDVATGQATCVASTGRHWAYPIFDHDGDTIYFIDGSDGARDDAGAKPFAVRTVDVSGQLDGSSNCPDASTVILDIRAATNSRVQDAAVVTRNAATQQADALFGVQINSDGRWRTVLFDSSGSTLPDWGFDDQTNPTHDDVSDGDASIWSPIDPYQIFTNRATGPDDDTAQRGVWTVPSPTLLYQPFTYDPTCSGDYRPSTGVAHSDWAYHSGTDTHIFLSSDRCPWLITGAGDVTLGPWRFFGYLHLNIDPTSLGGSLGDVRFVADEYFDGSGAEPFLYSATLADVGLGASDGFARWSELRSERKLVGHRNRMDDGSSSALKAYEPHPQFSPDGRSVLWQSSSLNTLLGYGCPAESCGGAGQGAASNVSYLDLYIAEVQPGQAETPVPVGEEVTVAVSCLADNGRVDTTIVNEYGSPGTYTIEFEGLTNRENVIAPRDFWRMPITGRHDGDYDLRVRRDGASILDTTVTVACDTDEPLVGTPLIELPEVQVISACRADLGYLLFQFVNTGADPRGWVIEFDGVPNRSTSAVGYAQSVRAVSGRGNGEWPVRIRTNGTVTHEFDVRTTCEGP